MTDRELDAWLAEHLFGWVYEERLWTDTGGERRAGWQHPDLVAWLHDFPPAHYSSTGDWMLLVLGAMREREFGIEMVAYEEGGFGVTWWPSGYSGSRSQCHGPYDSDTLPRAVAEAAKAALEATA